MGRFPRRLFSQISESATTTFRPSTNNRLFAAAPGMTLAAVRNAGFAMWDGGIGPAFNQPFNPATYGFDACGRLIMGSNLPGWTFFGEYWAGAAYYNVELGASRTARSCIMVEFNIIPNLIGGDGELYIIGYNGLTGGNVYIFHIETDNAPPSNLMTEVTLAPGGVGAAFTSQEDSMSNKVLISAIRMTTNQKSLVCSWWNRAVGAVASATLVHNGAGVGDRPIMWRFDGSITTPRVQFTSIQISSQPLAYGAAPAF